PRGCAAPGTAHSACRPERRRRPAPGAWRSGSRTSARRCRRARRAVPARRCRRSAPSGTCAAAARSGRCPGSWPALYCQLRYSERASSHGPPGRPSRIGTDPPLRSPPMSLARTLPLAVALLAAGAPALAAEEPPPQSPQQLLDASAPSDWRTPDPENLLYMDIPSGRVVIELAPRFAPEHVANIRALARGHFWDGLSIYRSQDNFVVQFGDPTEDEAARKPLGEARRHLPAEFIRAAAGLPFDALPDSDGYAPEVGFVEGFPAGRDPASGEAWLAHCYGALGAGRDV